MLPLLLLFACAHPRDLEMDSPRQDSDPPGDAVAVASESTYSDEVIGGYLVHQVAWTSPSELFGTFTLGMFREPRTVRVPDAGVLPDRCATSVVFPAAEGTIDLGATLTLQAGADTLDLRRDLAFEPGQVAYLRDAEASDPRGTTAGAELVLDGTKTGVLVPEVLTFSDPDLGFWEELFGSGTLDLSWEPGDGSAIVFVDIAVYPGAESRSLVCALGDDGRASIDTGWTDLQDAEGRMRLSRVHRHVIDLPSVGPTEVQAAADTQRSRYVR